MEPATWHEARLLGIGGSEAAALYGLLSWLTPLKLYNLKRGNSEEERDDERWALAHEMESVVVGMMQRFTDYKVESWAPTMQAVVDDIEEGPESTLYGEDLFCRHRVWPFMSCTPDGLCWLEGRPVCVFEAKNASGWMEKHWTDTVPDAYRIQVMHNGIVLGLRSGVLAAVVGGQNFRWATVEWTEDEAASHVERCREFWDRVQTGAEPEPMPSDTLDHYPDPHEGHTIDFDDTWLKLDDRFQEVAVAAKETAAEKSVLQKRFKQRLLQEQATRGTLPNGVVWKLASNGRIIREDKR